MIHNQTKSIDLLINNSGYIFANTIEDFKMEEFLELLNVNFYAEIKTINAAMKYLKPSKGMILNIGSMGGVISLPFRVFYSVSKNMVDAYTELMVHFLNQNDITICDIIQVTLIQTIE